ncbi:hypothetical protein PXO_05559 [Xanthomonas oryzae pv. oryzae PXO99A]|uniref:Uncharacterized protein n=1 Tax=Xanthomonas oryzae pv. oryzae (strain PXO99A) TaxID=360094 RepID=A0A0K0GJD6_XANOP|nr:hypothetical protein PXO_05559 [Xanthomonas oryzae pv. oryzae PXO99A]
MAQINARPTRAVHCAPIALGNAIAMALFWFGRTISMS